MKVGLWKKGEASESWLEGADWVVDAIDNVPTKASLRMMHVFHLTNPC
jgi:tRNA A37 threonylcarbamoyladenosine dehydratase